MGLRRVEALIDCDGCGTEFSVELDHAEVRTDSSIYDVVVDAVEDGMQRGTIGPKGLTSYHCDMMLCPVCTNIVDQIGNENYSPTREEIENALNQKIRDDS
jgi:hypothetical protein